MWDKLERSQELLEKAKKEPENRVKYFINAIEEISSLDSNQLSANDIKENIYKEILYNIRDTYLTDCNLIKVLINAVYQINSKKKRNKVFSDIAQTISKFKIIHHYVQHYTNELHLNIVVLNKDFDKIFELVDLLPESKINFFKKKYNENIKEDSFKCESLSLLGKKLAENRQYKDVFKIIDILKKELKRLTLQNASEWDFSPYIGCIYGIFKSLVDSIEKNKDYEEELLFKILDMVKIFHPERLRLDVLEKLLEIDNNLIYEKVIEFLNEYKTFIFNHFSPSRIYTLCRIAVFLDKGGYKNVAEEVFYKMLKMIPPDRYENHIHNRSYIEVLKSDIEIIITALNDSDILSVRINNLLRKIFGHHFGMLKDQYLED